MGENTVMLKWAKHIYLALMLLSIIGLGAMVPPHPLYKQVPANWQQVQPEITDKNSDDATVAKLLQAKREANKNGELPQNILALMVQFSDVQFRTASEYPDFLDHDLAYFERWMMHLQDFYADASHGNYVLDYTVYPQVFTLPSTMAHYGQDSPSSTDENLPFILNDLMPFCDNLINFNEYDGVVIFHAGAGQESDIEGIRTNNIWSTFLTRRTLQAAYDPDNDEYPGFSTDDGAVLTNVVIVPEDEFQDYFPSEGEDASMYLFSIYGVLAHQYAHILGLPTLFDNDSSNGRSQGIGNWGLMGTGVWNASGYVPAQLSAWCRYYLGWEDAVTITQDDTELPLDHFLNHSPEAIRLYKVPITDNEYFLIENRQQNPDGSLDPYSNLPSYTFKLLPEGEQDYYEQYPELPYFNFMENRYSGCEWDFFLPGFGTSPTQDGSGLLIWHIDEMVIAQNFTANFDKNSVNSQHWHKGVDLEEADGIQHLDVPYVDDNKYGGPLDSFRQGHNDYFGNGTYDDLTWLPTAQSYYGGVALEIIDISQSANRMTFGVRFAWKLDSVYEGENTIPAAAINFDGQGTDEIFYPMPDGKLTMFRNGIMMPDFPIQLQPIPFPYTWDGTDAYIPVQAQSMARLYKLNSVDRRYSINLPGYKWLSHPIDVGLNLLMPMEILETGESVILSYLKDEAQLADDRITLAAPLISNLLSTDDILYGLSLSEGESFYTLWKYDLTFTNMEYYDTTVPADSMVVGLFGACLNDAGTLNIIVQCPSSLYVFDLRYSGISPRDGFPVVKPDSSSAPIVIGDYDNNGKLDIIWSSSNRIRILDHSGSDLSQTGHELGLIDDGIASGTTLLDLDNDGRNELAGSFSMNRLVVWQDAGKIQRGYPVSFGTRGRFMPFVAKDETGQHYLWQASDRGLITRSAILSYTANSSHTQWTSEYSNLLRTAFYPFGIPTNIYETENSVFVKNETYIYPNPLKPIYEQRLRLSVMTTTDTQVELKIFDISGNMVHQQTGLAYAYLRNLDIFDIPAHNLSSGIYIAVLKGGGQTLQLRFGIEK